MAGRKPKPSALKLLQGNPGKRKLNKSEPHPTGVPDCPPELDADAKHEWTRISTELLALGLLTSVDRAALAAYCQSWSGWISAVQHIQNEGAVIANPSGRMVKNPWIEIGNAALDNVRRFAVEFGLTPSSRARLSVGEAEMIDPFDEFLAS